MNNLARKLQNNPKARANLIAVIEALGDPHHYSNQDCDRRQHFNAVVRDIENGFSGGNDTLIEMGLVWNGYCYTRPEPAPQV